MPSLDQDARIALESNIDTLLKASEEYEQTFSEVLETQGIESNLESILSYITGFLTGLIDGTYVFRYHRHMNRDEIADCINIMNRRAWELRQAFMNTRIER